MKGLTILYLILHGLIHCLMLKFTIFLKLVVRILIFVAVARSAVASEDVQLLFLCGIICFVTWIVLTNNGVLS